MTELERIDLETSDVDRYEGVDGDNADVEEEPMKTDDVPMQGVGD
jgi:hypothetical protein